MAYQLLAELLLVVHVAFIVFAALGGLLAVHRRWWVWLHLPVTARAAAVVTMGWICPLTPWEQSLRIAAGQQEFIGEFIEYYLLSIIYPAGLTRGIQIWLGVGVIIVNLLVYRVVWSPSKKQAT